MSAGLKRIDGLGGHGSRFFRASVKSALWLPLRLPIRYQKGLKPPLLATRIRRKYLALSAGYELLSKLPGTLRIRSRNSIQPPWVTEVYPKDFGLIRKYYGVLAKFVDS